MKTFAIMTLGCKVNDYESAYVKNKLSEEYEMVDFKEKSDIYIIFSCCVTNTAEAKTRKFIHQARRRNKDAYIVVVGCLVQIKPDLPDLKDVDLLICIYAARGKPCLAMTSSTGTWSMSKPKYLGISSVAFSCCGLQRIAISATFWPT